VRIVITGASGNVGTALLRRLSGSGHSLVGVTRRTPPSVPPYDAVDWVNLDLGDPDAFARLTPVLRGADAVVHLAWLIQPTHDRQLLQRANQGGARAVFTAVAAAGVPHLVHMSSVGTYAPAPFGTLVDESWPATGVPTSSYSVDKAACEAMLDSLRVDTIARVRPGLVFQPDAASEISRYFIGYLVPVSLIRPLVMKAVPWPPDLAFQCVHADDLADGLARIIEQRAGGAFNFADDPPIDRSEYRRIFGGVGPGVPTRFVRPVVTASWHARLQPIDAGWIDLAKDIPLMKTDRARTELGWSPAHSSGETLREFVEALGNREGHAGPKLYPRRLLGG